MLNPMPFDAQRPDGFAWENVLTLEGQSNFLSLLSRMAPGGLVWFAPPCNSWITSSQSFYGRTVDHPDGSGGLHFSDCLPENQIAEWLALAVQACIALGLVIMIENPLSSLLFEYAAIKQVLLEAGATKIAVALGKIGQGSLKPLQIWGTARWCRELEAAIAAGERSTSSSSSQLSVRVHNGWTGVPDAMDSSREYPRQFCTYIAKLHLRAFFNPAPAAEGAGEHLPRKVRSAWAKAIMRQQLDK